MAPKIKSLDSQYIQEKHFAYFSEKCFPKTISFSGKT